MTALSSVPSALALGQKPYVSSEKGANRFALCAGGQAAPLYASDGEYPGVVRALRNLQADVERVTKVRPELATGRVPTAREVVLAGTLGKSALIDRLVREKKLDVAGIAGRWETFLLQVVDRPLPGVERALVIAGSDKRGTIYGIYDLSEQIGVSPWYWWADVPVRPRNSLYVLPGRHSRGEPAVKYRGIFINDEAPALSGWTTKKFGGFNHRLYEKVFELLLRLRANYLCPAMWGSAFNDDDPLNPKLADEYGIVMGTSHHEPMMRAHAEWRRYGSGAWDYRHNGATLRKFWAGGIRRMDSFESIVTIGMRGDGDLPMPGGTDVALLERIVADQRKILASTTGRDPATIPELWSLYKEVQEFYDRGMRVPDDVTLLLCDDNWGNIRRLPPPGARRAGGYGIYYHFDYVGGPRSYKWLNTYPITKVWEQMHLAYCYGADRLWVVNVGDIKPLEFPIQFFLDYAWAPKEWPAERLGEYTRLWAEREFGARHAAEIADVVSKYTKYNGRRKPELLAPDTYSLVNYREAERVVAEYKRIAEKAERIYESLPAEAKDAFYQLVLYPVQACANLNDLYVTVGKNRLYARQGRAATNALAERARQLFRKDEELTRYYNKTMAGGKWDHMMDQAHIGYTSWQDPGENVMPEVRELKVPAQAEMAVAVEGSVAWWSNARGEAQLPALNPYQPEARYLEIFNRGQTPFAYQVRAEEPWLRVEPAQGKVRQEQRLWVSVDWRRAPTGTRRVPIEVTGPNGSRVVVQALIANPESPKPDRVQGFVETNGYVSIEAEHYTRGVNTSLIKWQRLPDYGRTLSAMTTVPVTAPSQRPGGNSPRLEYRLHLFRAGGLKVDAYFAPTLNFSGRAEGLRYAISFDDEPPQVIALEAAHLEPDWERSVADSIRVVTSRHSLAQPGDHVLKVWMVDPGVVLEKIVVDAGGVRPSYLGPPESFHRAP